MSKNRFLFNKYVLVMAVSGTLFAPLSVYGKDKGPVVEQLCASCHSLTNLEHGLFKTVRIWPLMNRIDNWIKEND